MRTTDSTSLWGSCDAPEVDAEDRVSRSWTVTRCLALLTGEHVGRLAVIHGARR